MRLRKLKLRACAYENPHFNTMEFMAWVLDTYGGSALTREPSFRTDTTVWIVHYAS